MSSVEQEAGTSNRGWYEPAFRVLPVPAYVWQFRDDDFYLTGYNEAAEAITAGLIGTMVGSRLSEVYRDRPEIRADFARCLRERLPGTREYDHILATTGETRHLMVTYLYVPDDLVIAHTQDLTERVRLERAHTELLLREQVARAEAERAKAEAEYERARLHTLFMEAPAIIAVLDGPDHVFTLTNPGFLQTVGQRPLLGKPVREAFPELDGQGFLELLDRTYASGEPFIGNEMLAKVDRHRTGELEEGYFNFVYQPYRDSSGAVAGILIHAVEVTELVQSRQQAEALAVENARLYAEAQESSRARDDFLAAASHDLKNPLTAIQGATQLMQRTLTRTGTVPPERLRHGLDGIASSVVQMTTLLDELLDVARYRMGRPIALELRPIDLVTLVQRVLGAFRAMSDRHTLHLALDLPDAEHSTSASRTLIGQWDATRLERVVSNLVGNAVKYSPDGGTITIYLGSDGNDAVLAVSDQGVGIPAAELDSIFEPFVRGGNVVGNIGGSGIGLATTRQIVEQHGGTISVQSEEDHGSTFTVRLPLHPLNGAPESGQ